MTSLSHPGPKEIPSNPRKMLGWGRVVAPVSDSLPGSYRDKVGTYTQGRGVAPGLPCPMVWQLPKALEPPHMFNPRPEQRERPLQLPGGARASRVDQDPEGNRTTCWNPVRGQHQGFGSYSQPLALCTTPHVPRRWARKEANLRTPLDHLEGHLNHKTGQYR